MEVDKRRMQPAHIGVASIETGEERFPIDGPSRVPSFSKWRNNLTALSRRYNLYFVAMNEYIAVFVPEFPYQKLRAKPSLLIDSTLANPNARGYIRPESPHDINHIIVGDLGNEEILLIARDSGNVDAYHTKSIQEAIGKDPYQFSESGRSDHVGLRAFFSHWVHESAWGLAIHKEARMIAVSANVPHHIGSEDLNAKITVFAFALIDGSGKESQGEDGDKSLETESEWQDWSPLTDTHDCSLPERKQNYKIALGNEHSVNIPSISFANIRDDSAGTWLFSTDIRGDTIAWNIWRDEVVNSWTMHWETDTPQRPGNRWGTNLHRSIARRNEVDTDRGWLVAALDPMAFRVANTMEEYCGLPLPADYQNRDSICATNIAGSHVPGNSQFHPLYPNLDGSDDGADDDSSFGDHESENEVDEDNENENGDAALLVNSQYLLNNGVPNSSRRIVSAHRDTIVPSIPAENAVANVYEREEALVIPQSDHMAASTIDVGDEEGSTSNDYDHDQDIESISSLSSFNPSYRAGTTAAFRHHVPSTEEGETQEIEGAGSMSRGLIKRSLSEKCNHRTDLFPLIPLLHCSVSHLRLFNAPLADKPHWFCEDVLTQLIPPQLRNSDLYHMERLNMLQQIPELGIVIIATQMGRCAVCSMLRKGQDGPFSLRVDWVLPTKKQERAGLRPFAPLMGIAVGPIQGMMIPPDTDSSHPDGDSDVGDEQNWKDGIIDGTPTSFDPNIVVLDAPSDDEFTPTSSQSRFSSRHDSKRPKPPKHGLSDERVTKLDQRPWQKSARQEAFRGHQNSRRYRLMLTFYDWTVLTYEISREAPDFGIDPARRNYRNRVDGEVGYHNIHAMGSEQGRR